MGDTVVKRLQIGFEGGYTSNANSSYNGGAAVVATRRLSPAKGLMFDWEDTWEREIEARATYAGVYQSTYMMQAVKGKIPALVYPDDLLYYFKMLINGAPTFAALPTTPTALLAATAIAATMSLTTQPNAAGDGALCKKLGITLSNASASSVAVTITIAGTDRYGNALSEQVVFTAGTTTPSKVGGGAAALTVTLYTQNYFKTVTASGITTSVQTAGNQVAVGGINAWAYTFIADTITSTLLSATGEYVDGTAAWQLIGLILAKAKFTAQMGKSFKLDCDAMARQKVALAGSTGSINPSALAGDPQAVQSIADSPANAIWTELTRLYADPIGTAPGTTLISNRLTDFSFDIDMAVKQGKAADLTPYPSFVGREAYGDKLALSFTALFNNGIAGSIDPLEVTSFLTQASRIIRAAFPGPYLPCGQLSAAGNWPAALQDASSKGGPMGVYFDVPGKYEQMKEKDVDGRAAFDFALKNEYDLGALGAALSATLVSSVDPNR